MAGEMISDAYAGSDATIGAVGEYAFIEWDEKLRMWRVYNSMTEDSAHFHSLTAARDMFDTFESRGKMKAEEVARMVENAIERNERYGTW